MIRPEPKSIFDIKIQAGTALTDKRMCDINDLDDCEDNISGRNSRYSEATAMYCYSELLCKSSMHICNVGVYKSELYNELCEWAFPILDDFISSARKKLMCISIGM